MEVISDDPLAGLDVPHMCHGEGFEVISLRRQDALTHMILRRPLEDSGGR
jgi:TusA-related sulfurtransferase